MARAVLIEETDGFEATITLHGGLDLVGKAQGDGLLKAVDAAVDKLTRQFESDAEKREGRERGRRASGRVKAAGVACFVKQAAGLRPGMQGNIPRELWNLKQLPQ